MSGNAFMPKRPFQPEPGVMDLLKDWPQDPSTDEVSHEGESPEHDTHGAATPPMSDMPPLRTNALFKPKSMPGQRSVSKTEAFEVKPLTAEDLEQIRQAAYDEGFQQGKEEGFSQGYQEGREQGLADGSTQGQAEGKKQGLAEGEALIREQLAQLQGLISQLQQPLQQLDQQVEQACLDLAVAMAQAVIGVEVKTNPQVILQSLRDAVEALPFQPHQLVIKLHPADLAIVQMHFSAEEISQRQWQLLAEPSLEPGDCWVSSEVSSVDRRIKTRLQASLEHFLQEPAMTSTSSSS